MLDPEAVTKLIRSVKAAERQYDCQFKTVWIDTFSRSVQGAPENEETWGQYIIHAERVKEEVGHAASVITIAHQGKTEGRGTRGSSVADCNADFVIEMSCDKDETPDEIEVHVAKLKDAEDGHKYQWVTCEQSWMRADVGKQSSLVLLEQDEETECQRAVRLANRAERLKHSPAKKQRDQKADKATRDAQLLDRICAVEEGQYTMASLCEAMGVGRGDMYERIRVVLPEGEKKVVRIGPLEVRSAVRTKSKAGELVTITVQSPQL
jgi:hypothetical protein